MKSEQKEKINIPYTFTFIGESENPEEVRELEPDLS